MSTLGKHWKAGPQPPEVRQKIADKVKFQHLGKKRSEETKRKMKENSSHYWKGKHHKKTYPNTFIRHPEGLEDDYTWNNHTHYYNYGEYADING